MPMWSSNASPIPTDPLTVVVVVLRLDMISERWAVVERGSKWGRTPLLADGWHRLDTAHHTQPHFILRHNENKYLA